MRSNAIKCSHFPGNSSHCTLCIVHFTLWFYIVHFTLWFYFVPPQHTSKLCTSQAPLLIRLKQLESYRTGTHFEATIASSLGLTDQLVEKTRKGQKVSGGKLLETRCRPLFSYWLSAASWELSGKYLTLITAHWRSAFLWGVFSKSLHPEFYRILH